MSHNFPGSPRKEGPRLPSGPIRPRRCDVARLRLSGAAALCGLHRALHHPRAEPRERSMRRRGEGTRKEFFWGRTPRWECLAVDPHCGPLRFHGGYSEVIFGNGPCCVYGPYHLDSMYRLKCEVMRLGCVGGLSSERRWMA